MSIRLFCIAAIAAPLCACTSPSAHHASNLRGGYGETQIGQSTFRVTYEGNATQNQSETNELALLRSAEVAQQHGYGWFMSGGNAATGTSLGLFASTLSIPATTLTIVCFPTRPDTTGLVYEADAVIATLGPKYRRL